MIKHAIIYGGRVFIPAEGRLPGHAYNFENGVQIRAAFEDVTLAGVPSLYLVRYDDEKVSPYDLETDAERIKAVEYFDSLLLDAQIAAEDHLSEIVANREAIYRRHDDGEI